MERTISLKSQFGTSRGSYYALNNTMLNLTRLQSLFSYCSLNFVFYITLSPSLRREICQLWRKRAEICHTLTKAKVVASFNEEVNGNADYFAYLNRLRSISPFRRRALSTTPSANFNHTLLDGLVHRSVFLNFVRRLFGKRRLFEKTEPSS